MGLVYEPEKDSDFVSLWVSSAFKSTLGKFQANRKPVGTVSIAHTIAGGNLITEGIAVDPDSKSTFVGSVRSRKILRIDGKGHIQEFSDSSDGLWGVFGMRIDSKHRTLWVCTSAVPQMEGYQPSDQNRVALFRYDLLSRKLRKKYVLNDQSHPHLWGDLVVDANGDVYLTDKKSPQIFIVRRSVDSLEVFKESALFSSLHGLDFSPDGTKLLVADYARGIFSVDMKTRKEILLPPCSGATLLSIDAFSRFRDGFVAVQNGITPRRVVRLTMDRECSKVTKVECLFANHTYSDPTLGCVVKNEYYFNGNGRWESVDDQGHPVEIGGPEEHVVLKIQLR
jgi:hypothetical protein